MMVGDNKKPMVRSRKARILEKAGLRYVAGWVEARDAEEVAAKIEAAKIKVDGELENVSR